MKNVGLKIVCGALVCGALFSASNVSAYNYNTTSEFRAIYWEDSQQKTAYIRPGDRTCVKSSALQEYYMYVWNEQTQNKLAEWPGVEMDQNLGDGVHCYTYNGQDEYNYVIFYGNSKQTIDLSVVNDSGNLVHSLVYLFEEGDRIEQGVNSGKYAGRWAVNDTSALVDMVEVAKNLNPDDYTIDSYAAVIAALGDDVDVEDVTVENQDEYDLKADYISKLDISNDVLGKLNIKNEGDNYDSDYLDAYNVLGEALNNLRERKAIIVDEDIQNGSVVAGYKSGSDSEVEIEVTPNAGYELESIEVRAILSYDEFDNPVLGDAIDIEIEPGETKYGYVLDDLDAEGIYITATFKVESGEEPGEDSDNVPIEDDGDSVEDEVDIAVPDTGEEQKMSQAAMGSLIGCMSVGAILGGVLGFINRKKISSYLKK